MVWSRSQRVWLLTSVVGLVSLVCAFNVATLSSTTAQVTQKHSYNDGMLGEANANGKTESAPTFATEVARRDDAQPSDHNLWPKSVLSDQAIRTALDASTADDAITSLAPVAEDYHAHQHIRLIGAICRGALKETTTVPKVDPASVDGQSRLKLSEFLKTYCGNVVELSKKVEAISARHPTAVLSEREEYVDALFALPRTEATADKIIDEIVNSPDLRESVWHAEKLGSFAATKGPLARFQKYLRNYSTDSERRAVFEIVGELLNCPRLGGCGTNQFHLAYECSTARNCRPGEDLFAYRRRTTSPELYQAAEQIAAEIQTERYH